MVELTNNNKIDIDKKIKVSCLIQTFIDELNNYEEITKYRLHKKIKENNLLTLFIWEIKPNEIKLNLWNEHKQKKSKLGNIQSCVNSELFKDIVSGEEAFEKQHLTLNFEQNEQILDNPTKKYYNVVRYHQDPIYKKYINDQIILFTSKVKYFKYKKKYLKLKYNIYK